LNESMSGYWGEQGNPAEQAQKLVSQIEEIKD
jgi:hypothetical protein